MRWSGPREWSSWPYRITPDGRSYFLEVFSRRAAVEMYASRTEDVYIDLGKYATLAAAKSAAAKHAKLHRDDPDE